MLLIGMGFTEHREAEGLERSLLWVYRWRLKIKQVQLPWDKNGGAIELLL